MPLKNKTLSGWLTTKKRGRDDDKIEKDKAKALQVRREKKTLNSKRSKTAGKTKSAASAGRKQQQPPAKKKKRKNDYDSEDDDELSEDSFIVRDDEASDEEEEEDEFVEDEESEDLEMDEEELVVDDDDDDGSDDDSSDNDDTFLGKHKKRASKPSALLSRIKAPPAAIPKPTTGGNRFSKFKNPYAHKDLKKKQQPIIKSKATFDLEDSDSDQQVKNPYSKKDLKKKQQPVTKSKATVNLEDSGSDQEIKNLFAKKDLKKKQQPIIKSKPTFNQEIKNPYAKKGLEKKQQPIIKSKATFNLEDSDSDQEIKAAGVKRINSNSNTVSLDDSSMDSESILFHNPLTSTTPKPTKTKKTSTDGLEDTPEVASAKKKTTMTKQKTSKLKKMKRKIVDDESDDDDVIFESTKKPAAAAAAAVAPFVNGVDDCSDEDEATALAWALSESTKAQQKKTENEEESEQQFIEFEDESDDDKNDDDNEKEDDYVDEDAKAASSILETANALSAQVLQNMVRWTQQNSGNSQGDTNGEVPMGMIVDGAVALSSLQGANVDDNNTSWISKETMKKVLPEVKLADYQLIGVNWMALLHGMKCDVVGDKKKTTTNVNGTLADEMGLGKTVQTIAFLSWLKYVKDQNKPNNKKGSSQKNAITLDREDNEETEVVAIDGDDDDDVANIGDDDSDAVKPHLIVAPASVLSNWEREFQKFAPHMNVVKYHGTMKEREEIQKELRHHLPGQNRHRKFLQLEPVDAILVPVTYFQKEKSDDRSFLRKFRFDYLVVDEAHLLKNSRGTRYKTLDRFTSEHRLLLTGTPVQNSPKELMSLLCFLMPLFSRKGSTDEFDDNPGHDGGESMLQHFVALESQGKDDQAAYRKLKQLFSPFVLRRKKQDVLSQIMPPKERRVEFVKLDEGARQIYDSVIAEHIEAKKNGKRCAFENLFVQLRKVAHHPLLVRSRYRSPAEKNHLVKWFHQYGAFRGSANTPQKVAEELEKFNDFEIHLSAHDLVTENPLRQEELGRYMLKQEDLFSSAKFERLRLLLPELVQAGHRILIFSGWTTILDLLTCLMDYLNFSYLRMEGSTPVSERQSLIDKFNTDTSIPVFLLSTKASGLGITLTSADVCIMHDLDFNPFNDLQAEDRCHRIGQTKKVTVIKMVADDTVDKDVYAMQERKAKMNAAIMENESEWNKEAKKARDEILQSAMDRFLKSPNLKSSKSSDGKENQKSNVEHDVI